MVDPISAGLALTPYIIELLKTAINGLTIAQKDQLTVEDLEGFRQRALTSEQRLEAAIQAAIAAKKAEEGT